MFSRLLRTLHTFTFRLGLVYVALFALSVVLVYGFVYTFAVHYMDGQISDSIRLRYGLLQDEYRANGSSGLESRIADLIESDDEGSEIYLLINNKGERLAGNLEGWPEHPVVERNEADKETQWLHFSIEGTRNHPANIGVRAISVQLSKWRSLLVGQTMLSKRKVEQTIASAFWASLLLTLVFAFIGALIVTRSVMHRLSVINRSVDSIVHGNLSARIPFTEGGDEFDELSHHLNRMLERSETLLHSLGNIANTLAHDLRSPLNRIVARTEAGLRGMRETHAARRLLEKNVEDIQALIGTFNSILRLTELEASTDFRTFAPCDLHRILLELAEFYEPLAAEKHITLIVKLTPPLMISGENNLLAQAFANIIDNAVKFTPEGGCIAIAGVAAAQHVDISITDTGPGVAAAYRERVFEKFFRVEASRHTQGNGLGLSLVAAVARIHGAEILLEDNDPGLRLRLRFPMLEA